MALKTQLGIYFGNKTLSVVETDNQVPEKFITVPQGIFDKPQDAQAQPDEIILTAVLQKTLREQKITATEASVALPTKEVLFRSFVIPWMQPAEVTGVVEFEARKYIPFKLEELVYTYHAITFTDNKIKKIRILFTAVKKEIFEKYRAILEQSGLTSTFMEPAAMSLVRALTLRNQIPSNQNIAIIQAAQTDGRIIIASDGIPQFIREFQLLPSSTIASEIDSEILEIRFFNEIRSSLNYYLRQHDQKKIDGIIVLTVDEATSTAGNLGRELGIATVSLSANSILGTSSLVDIDLLYAFGIGLHDTVSFPANFNLMSKASSGFQFSIKNINRRSLLKTGIACLALLVPVFVLSNRLPAQSMQRVRTLEEQQGPYKDLSLDDIELQNTETLKKLSAYQNIPQATHVAKFLDLIPEILPSGTWLTELEIKHSNDVLLPEQTLRGKKSVVPPGTAKAAIEMSGYAFQQDVSRQIRMINTFVSDLKNDRELGSYFQSIDLLSAQTQTLEGHVVTNFKIVCQ